MSGAVLLSIDPGLDRAAAALWDVGVWKGRTLDVVDQAQRLRGVYECKTDPRVAMPARLAQLSDWAWHLSGNVRALLNIDVFTPLTYQPITVVIEWPATYGLYAGRATARSHRTLPNAASMAGLYSATGAIVASISRWCDPGKVSLEPAKRVERELKQTAAAKCLAAAQTLGCKLPSNDDIRSAVFIGLATEWRGLAR